MESGNSVLELSPGEIAAEAAGVPQTESGEVSYFGFDNREKFYLPGSKTQYFEYCELPEGKLKYFQSKTSRDVLVKRGSGDAKMRMDAGEERWELIRAAVTDWHLLRPSVGGKGHQPGEMLPVPFSDGALTEVLETFPSSVIADLEKAIRKLNPAINAAETVEDLTEQIKDLEERRANLIEAERGR